MGDGVNIAARLEGVAKPGGICLSEDAYRQLLRLPSPTYVAYGRAAFPLALKPNL